MRNKVGVVGLVEPIHRRQRAALVLLRTALGIVYLSNGLAKLISFKDVTIGPWKSYLIDRPTALGIQTSNTKSAPGFLHDLGQFVVDNWSVFQWLLTIAEVGIGLSLLLGLVWRLGALAGLLLSLSTFIFTIGSGGWTYDYLFEPLIFLALVLVPALPGLDSRLGWGSRRRATETTATGVPVATSGPPPAVSV